MNIQNKIKEALDCCSENKLDNAKEILLKILKKFPKQPQALSLLSNLACHEKNYEAAETYLQSLSDISKLEENQIQDLINIKLELNKAEEAIKLSEKIKQKNQNYFLSIIKAYRLLGSLDKLNEITQSKEYKLIARDLEIILSTGYTYNFLGDYFNAIKIYEKNKEYYSNDNRFQFNYAIALNNIKHYDDAIKVFRAIEDKIKIVDTSIKMNIAASYMFKNDYQKAIDELDLAIEHEPYNHDLLIKKAFILLLDSKKELALEIYDSIINSNPNYYPAYLQKGFVQLKSLNFNDGWSLYRYRQLVDTKKCKVNDFELEKIDWLREIKIYSEQGVGDWLFHLRMLSAMPNQKLNLSIAIDSRMHKLIEENYEVINFINDKKIDSNKQNINLGSIGRFVIKSKETIKNIRPWKVSKTEKFEKILDREKVNIGISWKSQNKEWGDDKSIALELFKVFNEENFNLINLQYGDVNNEIENSLKKYSLKINNQHNLDLYNDIYGLAQLINECDIVVTISNVTAHIAGLINKPTVLMLPKNNGKMWYWTKDKSNKSIWYPSVRIIDYEIDGGWQRSIKEAEHLVKTYSL